MNLEIIPQAERDISEAAHYYHAQRPGLQDEFLAEVESAMMNVVAAPLSYEQVRPGIRRYMVNRFPYGVYYRTPDEHTVRIIVVKHHSRRPGLGMRRE